MKGTSIPEGYLVYKNLSRDAAHPSFTALAGTLWVRWTGSPRLDVEPAANYEMIQTVDLATIALMSTCAAVEDNRPTIEGDMSGPYLWIDATYVEGRSEGRIVSMAVTMETITGLSDDPLGVWSRRLVALG